MTPWHKLAVVAITFAVILYIAGYLASAREGLVLAFFTGVLATPFGTRLTSWVEAATTSSRSNLQKVSAGQSATTSAGTEAGTALFVFATNTYGLLLINVVMSAFLVVLQILERAQLLSFRGLGYIELQKYLARAFMFTILVPSITAVGLVLGSSKRPLTLRAFFFGTALALPIYLLLCKITGLGIGFGAAAQTSLSLGGRLPHVPGYSGFEWTAILYQVGMLSLFALVVSIYGWVIARLGRLAVRQVRRLQQT